MNNQDLEQLFNEANKTPSSAEAKLRARNAALEAFDEVFDHKKPGHEKNSNSTQGSAQSPRLTPEPTDTDRSKPMFALNNFTFRRVAISSMASAAVLILAFTMAISFYPELNLDSPAVFDDKLKLADAKLNVSTPESRAIETTTKREQAQLQEVMIAGQPQSEPAMDMAPLSLSGFQQPSAALARKNLIAPQAEIPSPYYQETGRDQFEKINTNSIKLVSEEPVSTFSVDVDTAAYAFVRRQLNHGRLPQKDAVRLEEMVNYFNYHYAAPTNKLQPFNSNIAVFESPWHSDKQIVHIGIKGYEIAATAKPKSNLVFLLDVSGSMNAPDKLPLVKQSMNLLLSQLNPEDTVSIVVYAGAAGTVLEPTLVKDKAKILTALQRLQAGGSTAGAQGIQLAYQLAEANFVEDGVNRIILATDGDFNVGITNREELKSFVERKRESNIFLSVLGFGQGNYHDQMMQTLAQNGNGVAAYIDTLSEAQKVLVEEATSSLFPIAKDVKIQVEFNPAQVKEYRLLGYETRLLNREDFNNDKVDAGDIGAGHTVTALYEITPVSGKGSVDELRYQNKAADRSGKNNELGFVKIRYKLPEQSQSQLISQPIPTLAVQGKLDKTLYQEGQFATAVAGFAQLLRGGQYTGNWSYDDAITLAKANKGVDDYGYRSEFVQLIRKAKTAQAM